VNASALAGLGARILGYSDVGIPGWDTRMMGFGTVSWCTDNGADVLGRRSAAIGTSAAQVEEHPLGRRRERVGRDNGHAGHWAFEKIALVFKILRLTLGWFASSAMILAGIAGIWQAPSAPTDLNSPRPNERSSSRESPS
jgi:hypothetical protein